MRTGRIAALLTVALLLGTALPGVAAPPAVAFSGAGVVRGDLGSFRGAPLAAARRALAAHAGELGVDATAFTFDQVRRSNVGVHVRGAEVRDGVAVEGTSAAVHAVSGRVVQIEARGLDLPGRPTARPVAQAVAVAAATARLSVTETLRQPVAERLLVARGARLTDVWRVAVLGLSPAVAAHVDVDAATGRALAVHDARVLADGTATVFDPNPIVSKQDAALRQPLAAESAEEADLDSAELTAELKVLPILGYDAAQIAAGRLVGPWASVQGPGPLVSVPGATTFSFTRGDPRFETTMAYAHLDRAQRYFQEQLGFTGDAGVNAEPQDTYTLPVMGFDNSFYMPAYDLLLFGAGGVDDAEDAEVILHEYGHAVHDAQVDGWGARHEGGAMGEGFGDFLAAAFYGREISGGFGDVCIMDWDATSYSSADPPCLRRADSDKRYPEDMTGGVHADGELWSSFLWRLRSRLGETSVEQSDNVIKLVLTSHEFLTTTAEFGDAIAALRQAAVALGQPEWTELIDATANETGMPLNPQ